MLQINVVDQRIL